MESTAWRTASQHQSSAPTDVQIERVAEKLGTPLWCYSAAILRASIAHWQEITEKTNTRVAYSIKANPHRHIIEACRGAQFSFDIASGGEMRYLLALGIQPSDLHFFGVGKTSQDLQDALDNGVRIVIESVAEWQTLSEIVAVQGKQVFASLRLNLTAHRAETHEALQTTGEQVKFGVLEQAAQEILASAPKLLVIDELCTHLGSDVANTGEFTKALAALKTIADGSAHPIELLDMGGGYPIGTDLAGILATAHASLEGSGYRLGVSPGRAMVADSGVLLTRVVRTKETQSAKFLIVDAGMQNLVRPAMYGARHPIDQVGSTRNKPHTSFEVVGPICESTDTFGVHELPDSVREGDLLCISFCGAYGEVMSSNYLLHPKAGAVLLGESAEHDIISHPEPEGGFFARFAPTPS